MINKIFNWTVGSVFRTIGRFLGFLVIGALIVFIMQKKDIKITDLLGIYRVSAKTFTTTENYRVRRCQAQCACDCTFTSWTSNGTSTSINTSSYVSDGLSMNLGTNDVFYSGTSYRVYNSYDFSGSMNFAKNPYNFNCFGATSNSTSGGEDTNIQSCTLVGVALKDNNITYVFDVVPLVDIKAIKINIYFSAESWTSIKGNTSKSSVVIDTSASDAINNQTDELLQNQNSNTQTIINNQNQNTQAQIESQRVCRDIDKNNIELNNKSLNSIGQEGNSSGYGITSYININKATLDLLTKTNTINAYACFYNVNKEVISCVSTKSSNLGQMTIPNNSYYFRGTIVKDENMPTFKVCQDGNQAVSDSINDLNNTLTDNTLNDSDISDSLDSLNVETESLGVFSTFLTLPLTWVRNILASNQTCTPINLPLPYMENKYLTLPCMSNFWQSLGALNLLIQACWLCVVGVRIFNGLFLLTVDTISSDDNADQLTKIKSWEL